MAQDEFSIIDRYFSFIGKPNANTRLAVGDDAAVVDLPPGQQLVVSMDTLVSGIHFPQDSSPGDIAYKALAVNLSDLAAMAAEPAWFLLSLTLPQIDEDWLSEFSTSLNQLAERYQIELIGGDICRGALAVTIQIGGQVPDNGYVTRAQARTGDLILVSGELGNAALGLAQLRGDIELPEALSSACLQALRRPQPRLELIPFLREFASAAIDISDGLQADLGHILQASGCGATINRDLIPVNDWIKQSNNYQYALTAGDDYEICCSISATHLASIEMWNHNYSDCRLTVIGEMTETGYYLQTGADKLDLGLEPDPLGYRHFD